MHVIAIRTGLLAALFTAVAAGEPAGSPAQQRGAGWPAIKQWTAEVIVTADCDRSAVDGSRTIIHNRIQTTYAFTQRLSDSAIARRRRAERFADREVERPGDNHLQVGGRHPVPRQHRHRGRYRARSIPAPSSS